ncbi:MAG TPA: hypothetical protein VLB06_03095 [Sulfuricaulis sp.]|nr:hypothetical protein [Sulfuricaulis sp.]
MLAHLLAPFLALFRVGLAFSAHFGAVRFHLFALLLAFLGVGVAFGFQFRRARFHLLAALWVLRAFFLHTRIHFLALLRVVSAPLLTIGRRPGFASGVIGQRYTSEQAQKGRD